MLENALHEQQIDQFVEDGYLHLEEVVPAAVVAAGQEVIWSDIGMRPDDPASWTAPVLRVVPSDPRPFSAAFDNPRLSTAFDQIVGAGRWQHRPHLGQFVVRLPHRAAPSDTGWHVDESFPAEGRVDTRFDYSHWRVNVLSRQRALLLLFLFSDVGPDDGPTLIRVGSHLDVPALLRPAGLKGLPFSIATRLAAQASASRPVALATGRAGDVYLFHPFLVHAGQPVAGSNPRFVSQTPLVSEEPVILDQPAGADSPMESAVRRGLATGAVDSSP